MTHTILIAGKDFSFAYEPRIINQTDALKTRFRLIGLGSKTNENMNRFYVFRSSRFIERFIKLTTLLGSPVRFFLFKMYLSARIGFLKNEPVDLVIANNLDNGVIALLLGRPFVFDSHEYLIGQMNENNWWWRMENSYYKYVLAKILAASALVTAEGERVIEKYRSQFTIPCDNFLCTPNTPKYHNITPAQQGSGPITFIHHGLASPRRGLDFFIHIFGQLPQDYRLTLMLSNTSHPYYKELVAKAAPYDNISFAPPVPYADIVSEISQYDASLVFFNSNNYHHKFMTVPNKFWESLQARLPVVVSAASAMADTVEKYRAGFTCEGSTVQDFVHCIQKISRERITECKRNIQENAFLFSAESWYPKYVSKVDAIIQAAK